MKIIQDFVSIVFPNYCRGCFNSLVTGEHHICIDCASRLPRTNYHLNQHNDLRVKMMGSGQIKLALAYLKFVKGGKVQNLLHHLKYENCPEIGTILGKWYGKELSQAGFADRFDLIVPVPLHDDKLKKRGYNQSESFAAGLGESLNCMTHPNFLKRIRNTPTQTKKSKLQRWRNVEGAFQTAERLSADQRVLIVDDIVTTGATLEACAFAVAAGGCTNVSVAAIATAI